MLSIQSRPFFHLIRFIISAGFFWRLLIPILLIYCLPTEEVFFQNLFQGEGIIRIIKGAWSFRFSTFRAIKEAGNCSFIFAIEEGLQEGLLWCLL